MKKTVTHSAGKLSLAAGALALLTSCQSHGEVPARTITRQVIAATLPPDVTDNHPHAPAIRFVLANNIMIPERDGLFHPEVAVTRGALLQILMDAAHIEPTSPVTRDPFPDVSRFHPQAGYVLRALEMEIVRGYQDGPFRGQFRIDRIVSLIETLKVLLLTQGIDINNLPRGTSFTDVPAGEWYEGVGLYAQQHHLVDAHPDGSMGRDDPMTRAAIAEVIWRFLHQRLAPRLR
ncbi:MAG: S-layer homology domain-containing protein [Candidatus Abawacabacteria bacterium]|nr:S-layer homology domain-containing protein [Candidatus Abawacabacteria bacterium]